MASDMTVQQVKPFEMSPASIAGEIASCMVLRVSLQVLMSGESTVTTFMCADELLLRSRGSGLSHIVEGAMSCKNDLKYSTDDE